jgi:hypothetical protein
MNSADSDCPRVDRVVADIIHFLAAEGAADDIDPDWKMEG